MSKRIKISMTIFTGYSYIKPKKEIIVDATDMSPEEVEDKITEEKALFLMEEFGVYTEVEEIEVNKF